MKKITSLLLVIMSLLIVLTGCSAGDKSMENNAAAGDAYFSPESSVQTNESLGYIDVGSEDYGKFIENEFISTLETPVSTFSADVDTASYAYFRKLVNQGYNLTSLKSVAGSSLRTEEMVNYFKYSYNGPTKDNELFGVNVEIADCAWNENAKLMVLGLQSEEIEIASSNNLVFLIDVSGSMRSDDKLELIKKSFSYLVQNLGADDRVSIVTYSGKEEVVLSGCEGNKHEQIMKAINSLSANGSTNGEAGIKKAYQIAEANYINGGNNRIILASDGDLNVGISSPEELEALISQKKNEGVYLSVLGFGTGNYKDANMETLADKGNGIYYYIDGEGEAEKVFGGDLFSTLYTIAEDVKLQITFDPEYVSEYRLVGYENRLLNPEDFENDFKDAGEIGSGHSVTVCYELVLTEKALDADADWLKLAIRHKNPGQPTSILNEYDIGYEYFTSAPSSDFEFICAVVETSMILHDSKYTEGKTLDTVSSRLAEISTEGAYDAGQREEFKQLIASLTERK